MQILGFFPNMVPNNMQPGFQQNIQSEIPNNAIIGGNTK